MLTLRVLGTLDLRGEDGRDLPAVLAQPKRAALLAYLCVRAPAGYCRRDTLLALFWPEADTERARAALRGALHFLRRTISEDLLLTRGDDVGVDPERLTCDATLFERAVADGRLDEALTLYGGDLLDGVHVADAPDFEQWRDDERARLRRAAIDAAKALGERRETDGDLPGAIHAARRASAMVPDDETLAQRVMILLDRAGDRAGALHVYDELSARLRITVESDPSPETQALVDTIRRRDQVASPRTEVILREANPPDVILTRSEANPPDVILTRSEAKGKDRSPGEAVPSSRRPTRPQVALAATAATLVVLAVFAGISSLRARTALTASPASPDVVVVLPFTYKGASNLSYVGDGMGRLVTTNLNGAGTMRIIDPVAVQRALDRDARGGVAGIDSAQARHIADRFSAGLVVTGQVSEAAGRLRVSADVIARGRSTSQIVVDGTSDHLFDLVDELTTRLIAAWGTEKGQRLTSIAARTTHSLPALRAYLDGERNFTAGRYTMAVDDYQRAVAADSTFALAYYRLSSALIWTSVPYTQNATRQARRFVSRLSHRDSMLVEARYTNSEGRPNEAERLYRALLADYPDEIEAWYQLGEVQYHWAGELDRSAQLSEPAFEHALALDPVHVPALVHLARLAASTKRLARLDSLRARLAPLPMDPEESLEVAALRSFTGEPSDERTRVSAKLIALGAERVRRNLPPLAASTEDLDQVLSISRALDAQRPGGGGGGAIDVQSQLFEAQLELARGRWRAANATLDRVADRAPALAAQYRGAFAAATLFPVDADELTRERAAVARAPTIAGNPVLERAVDPSGGLYAAQRAYVLARLSARAHDSSAALRALEEARAGGPLAADSAVITMLTRQIRAELLGQAGRWDEGLRLLGPHVIPVPTALPLLPSFRTADERFLRAELLRMAGHDTEALAAYASFPDPGGYDLVYLAPAHLRQAEILDRRGDRAAAREHYRRFVALWSDCDAELRPQVEAARRRLAALGT